MKVALVHELLTMRGGAEQTLRVLADMFPDAPIYTLLYDEKKLRDWFPRDRVRFSSLQKYACFSTNHHWYLRHFPQAVESWRFDGYDLVISSSSAFAHGIITSPPTKHLCYVHSPARYLWDRTFDVQDTLRKRPLGKMLCVYYTHIIHMLRKWDALASERGDTILAASQEVQRRIELYWRRESEVLHPPVDVSSFILNEGSRGDFYVVASSLVPYKRLELAIEACSKLKRKLKVIGEGPAKRKLQSLAGNSVEFFGYVSEDRLRKELGKARAFILPGEEDFGIAPIEAMACGTPVIAYGKGGALETVVAGETGEFFYEASAESLSKAIEDFESKRFDVHLCRKRAEKYARDRFEEGIRNALSIH
jgi:glycosyltransferase involved in cell wall biosynthesis